jgi:phosphatidylserine/phosphatidylglycerophosphate/cardiolipin synthase-like enzyme
MDFPTMKATYGTADPPFVAGNSVTVRVGARDYHDGLAAAFATVGAGIAPADNKLNGDFIYIANWWLGLLGGKWTPPPASGVPSEWTTGELLPYPFPGGKDLFDVLTEKAAAGVDVRVMGWCHLAVLNEYRAMTGGLASMARINAMTAASVRALRSDPNIGGNAILNVIHHTAGAAHAKLVVVGNDHQATGFTGGLDFVSDRVLDAGQDDRQPWHDVVAEIAGQGVQGLYDWFTLMWTENLMDDGARRPPVTFRLKGGDLRHVLATTTPVKARTLTGGGGGTTHVQSLRTLPARNYRFFSLTPSALRVSWPDEGEFRLRTAWEKAIKAAETYIYMEDQSFNSTEVFGWINDRVTQAPSLHVILVTGAGKDPNDPAIDSNPYLCESINRTLLKDLDASQLGRIRLFQRFGQDFSTDVAEIVSVTPNGTTTTVELSSKARRRIAADSFSPKANVFLSQPAADAVVVGNPEIAVGAPVVLTVVSGVAPAVLNPGRVEIHTIVGVFVHTKTTIVDDRWALVGSANSMRRSLYTDCEHAVAFLDEPDGAAVKEYRKRLWASHFRADPALFDDIQESLHAWEPAWGTAGAAPARPTRRTGVPGPGFIDQMTIGLPNCRPLTPEQKEIYDIFLDADSRDPWGFVFPPGRQP